MAEAAAHTGALVRVGFNHRFHRAFRKTREIFETGALGEMMFILVLGLLLFGPKKLPELGKGLGDGIRALKEGLKDHPAEQAKTDSTTSNTDVKS